MSEVKLKPCPFCGSADVKLANNAPWLSEKYQGNIRTVGCRDCGVNGGIFNTLVLTVEVAEEKAIRSWNRRVDNA